SVAHHLRQSGCRRSRGRAEAGRLRRRRCQHVVRGLGTRGFTGRPAAAGAVRERAGRWRRGLRRGASCAGAAARDRARARVGWPLDGESNAQPTAAAAWGLGNTIRTELGGTACRFIDLDAETPIESIREMLANAALTSSAEDRLALRRGRWYAARLTRIPPR